MHHRALLLIGSISFSACSSLSDFLPGSGEASGANPAAVPGSAVASPALKQAEAVTGPWAGLCKSFPTQHQGMVGAAPEGGVVGQRERDGLAQMQCSRRYQAATKWVDIILQASTYEAADGFPPQKPGWRFVSSASPTAVEQLKEVAGHLVYLSHDSKTQMGQIKVRLKSIVPAKAFGGWIDMSYAQMVEKTALEFVQKLDWKAMKAELDKL